MRMDDKSNGVPALHKQGVCEVLSVIYDKNIDLMSSYLISLTAATLGMSCEFRRGYPKDYSHGLLANQTQPLPTLCKVGSGPNVDHFVGSISTTKVNLRAAKLTKSKVHTRRALAEAGVRTPIGGLAWSDNTSLLESLENAGVTRVTLKPNKGSFARGLKLDISIDEARAHIKSRPDEAFVVEQHIVGVERRLYFVGGVLSESFIKARDHVLGNGKDTLLQLVARKTQKQLGNPNCRMKMTPLKTKKEFLTSNGHNLSDVPAKGLFIPIGDDPLPKSFYGAYKPKELDDGTRKMVADVARCTGADAGAIDAIDTGRGGIYALEVNVKPTILPPCFPINAAWNLRLPEALLRNSFPDHQGTARQVADYDFTRLLQDYRDKPEKDVFDVQDYMTFAS